MYSNKITITSKKLNLKQSTHLSTIFLLFVDSLSQNFYNVYASTTKKLDFNSILNNVLNEGHRNSHFAKQKQRKRRFYSARSLTDRTHLRVQYTNSCELNNPVESVIIIESAVILERIR